MQVVDNRTGARAFQVMVAILVIGVEEERDLDHTPDRFWNEAFGKTGFALEAR